jgi:hypothetical protein
MPSTMWTTTRSSPGRHCHSLRPFLPAIGICHRNQRTVHENDSSVHNQETERFDITEIVDERTQFEVYYRPFKAAVDAGLLSVMCSVRATALSLPLLQSLSFVSFCCRSTEANIRLILCPYSFTVQQDTDLRAGFRAGPRSRRSILLREPADAAARPQRADELYGLCHVRLRRVWSEKPNLGLCRLGCPLTAVPFWCRDNAAGCTLNLSMPAWTRRCQVAQAIYCHSHEPSYQSYARPL